MILVLLGLFRIGFWNSEPSKSKNLVLLGRLESDDGIIHFNLMKNWSAALSLLSKVCNSIYYIPHSLFLTGVRTYKTRT